MRLRTYRRLILIFAVWVTLSIPTTLLPFMSVEESLTWDSKMFALPIGFALLPISAFGLWNLRLWGFTLLVVGFVIIAAVYPDGIHPHAICIVLTILQYY